MMDHNLWQISDDPPWNPDSMKLVAMVQNNSNGDIHQSMQMNVNEFDIDNDGVANRDDNCMFESNPGQEDAGRDDYGGDARDPSANAENFLDGTAKGEYGRDGD